ncbi:C-type lectin domain family 12 member A isoform X2 [Suricata suricatta]|uniref:C-type lectin domain family 12 member A n=1 Tax=Suricata suricatta TaxID=37032 RepID=A0A673T2U4_SURSU|nr:C-type lectin domain family 12 member A isoform X2 [Suricata suricatta]
MNFELKAPPATSHVWHQRALALTLLCLLLLIGLGVLGSIFYMTLKKEMRKLNNLQNFKEELQRNVSLQLMHSMNSSKMIRDLSLTLQEIATKLCYELYKRQPEHKCKPCPKTWIWHEDNCYLVSMDYVTWQESAMFCSAQNASLLMIKNKHVLEFVKSRRLRNYWLGLPPREDYNSVILDEKILSSNWFIRNANEVDNRKLCGYLDTTYIYYTYCTNTKNIICEKLANPVKIENTLMSETSDRKYN